MLGLLLQERARHAPMHSACVCVQKLHLTTILLAPHLADVLRLLLQSFGQAPTHFNVSGVLACSQMGTRLIYVLMHGLAYKLLCALLLPLLLLQLEHVLLQLALACGHS